MNLISTFLTSLFVISSPLFGYYFFIGFFVPDLVYIIIAIIALICIIVKGYKLKIPNYLIIFAIFILYNLALANMQILVDNSFNFEQFIRSIMKLIFYFLVFVFFIQIIHRGNVNYELLPKLFIFLILLIFILQIIQYYLLVQGNLLSFNIEGHFDRGDGSEEQASQALFYKFGEIIRPAAFFPEPSYLAIYVNTLLFSGLMFYKNRNRLYDKYMHGLFIIASMSVIITLSFTGYILLLFNSGLYMYNLFWFRRKRVRTIFPVILAIPFCYGFYVFNYEAFDVSIIQRIDNAFRGAESSSNDRLIGSYEYAIKVLKDNRLGIAMGQSDQYIAKYSSELIYKRTDTGSVVNIYAYILLTAGLIGLLLFILFQFCFCRKNISVIMYFFLICSASGGLISLIFWNFILITEMTLNFTQRQSNFQFGLEVSPAHTIGRKG